MENLKFTGDCNITMSKKTVTPFVIVGKTLKNNSEDDIYLNEQEIIFTGFLECPNCNMFNCCGIANQVKPIVEKINKRGENFSPIY